MYKHLTKYIKRPEQNFLNLHQQLAVAAFAVRSCLAHTITIYSFLSVFLPSEKFGKILFFTFSTNETHKIYTPEVVLSLSIYSYTDTTLQV